MDLKLTFSDQLLLKLSQSLGKIYPNSEFSLVVAFTSTNELQLSLRQSRGDKSAPFFFAHGGGADFEAAAQSLLTHVQKALETRTLDLEKSKQSALEAAKKAEEQINQCLVCTAELRQS